jgi:hypothetical protein
VTRKTRKQRNAEQLERSANNRVKAKLLKKPSRDDIARMALWRYINSTWRGDARARETLDMMRDDLVDELEKQGFDPRQVEERFEELAEKYRSDLPPFRIKCHLQTPSDRGTLE